MRLVSLILATLMAVSCSGTGAPEIPTFDLPQVELPSFDTAALEQLVDDALAEVDRVADDPPQLPTDFQRLLDDSSVPLPSLPTNAAQICDALGIPGVSGLAAAALTALIEQLVVGAELGLVIGVLAVVTARTCPIWMPYLEQAADRLL